MQSLGWFGQLGCRGFLCALRSSSGIPGVFFDLLLSTSGYLVILFCLMPHQLTARPVLHQLQRRRQVGEACCPWMWEAD